MSGRSYRRSRSPSRTPPRAVRESFRDNYNPYRDERRGANDRGYARDRSLSPRPPGRFSPPGAQGYPPQEPRSPPGRSRGGEGDTETIPIEKSLVGLIIGRSGENLRRVESSTGARVQFMDGPESSGATRHCKISGGRAARAAAKAEIYRIIDENGNANRGGGGGGQDYSRGQPKAPSSTNSKDGENSQIMVPDRTVGLIIGRGGETIRDLQERSGCHVNIVGENKSVNGLRPVNLIGSVQAQQRAKDLIMEIVESDTKNMSGKGPDAGRHPGRDDPYASGQDKMNDSIMVPGEAVGMIIGKGTFPHTYTLVAAF
jgi:far upstream element-binding protein